MTIKKIAQDRGCTVIATTYDTYTAARLINQSMPISYFMTREHLITFNSDDYIDEIRDVMAASGIGISRFWIRTAGIWE